MRLDLTTLVVRDYDEAIAFYVGTLGFVLAEDTDMGDGKRWVAVRPTPTSSGLLLATADDSAQHDVVGRQTGGRVSFFLHVDDFDSVHSSWVARGVNFVERPRTEPYGKVAVFEDLYGNRWDLIQPVR